MIETEKLKQMLLNHEPIWCVGLGGSVFKIGNKKKDTERLLDYYVKKYSGDNYFESEKRAQWRVNFENIFKFEQISLPYWDEIEQDLAKSYGTYCLFDDKGITIDYIKDKYCSQNKVKLAYIDDVDTIIRYFDATPDGYEKCCEMARKIFLGEKL